MQERKFSYIFDFDGVLVDSMGNYYHGFHSVLMQRYGIDLNEDEFMATAGMPVIAQWKYLIDRFQLKDANPEELQKEMMRAYLDNLLNTPVIESNANLLRTLRATGHLCAIASGSRLNAVQPLIEKYGLEADAVITADLVKVGKPDPETFLLAAKTMGSAPRIALLLRTLCPGVVAAKAAHMRVMHFTDTRL